MAADDPEAALTRAISVYCAAHGIEATGQRLLEALAVMRRAAKVQKVHDRILLARLDINAAAVERFEVHDDEGAEEIMDQPTPNYPGAHADDMWLRTAAGYSIQEGGRLMPKPKERPTPMKEETPTPARGHTVSRLQRDARPAALPEPDATAAVLLAALLDDPVRIDSHLETLAGLPCGRFAAVQGLLLDEVGGFEGVATHPAVLELRDALGGQGGPGKAYSADGWERAARSLAARWAKP